MLEKTIKKLKRRFEVLPLHHIDTSVILEPENTEDGRYCRRYLQLVGYKYRGRLSLSVFGEILLGIKSLKDYREQHDALDLFLNLVEVRKIETYVSKRIEETMKRIRQIDSRIEPTDVEILACAVENNAITLVTLDKKLIHNENLEKEFDIKIRHPNELF